ncbi:hypothetical protein PTKIN_Ptkin18bG0152600 [Pterospermum kingtungense]
MCDFDSLLGQPFKYPSSNEFDMYKIFRDITSKHSISNEKYKDPFGLGLALTFASICNSAKCDQPPADLVD